jgi:hypothetical protein
MRGTPSCSVVHSPTPQGVLRLRRFQGGLINQELRSQLLEIESNGVGVEAGPQFPICISSGESAPMSITTCASCSRCHQTSDWRYTVIEFFRRSKKFIDDRLHLVTIPTILNEQRQAEDLLCPYLEFLLR